MICIEVSPWEGLHASTPGRIEVKIIGGRHILDRLLMNHDRTGGEEKQRRPFQVAEAFSDTLEVNGLRLHHLDYGGAGPSILCLHGGGAHAHWFDLMAARLVPDHHVRSMDLRGHGDSQWAEPPDYSYGTFAGDVAEYVEKLDLRDFVLVGHSMGGLIALVYAARFPGRVKKLVVIDSMQRLTQERVARMHEVSQRARSYESQAEFISRYRLRPHGDTVPPSVVRHMAEYAGRRFEDGSWRHKLDRNVYANRDAIDGLPCWSQIAIPALLVRSEFSSRITPSVFAAVKARHPTAHLVTIDGSDHHIPLDRPIELAQAVRDFIEQRTA